MNAKEIFMNGEFIAAEHAVIPVRTHGFSYGTGCFEGIRGYWNEEDQQIYLFRIREHYERLLRSCKILQTSLPYTAEQLVEISIELIKRNGQREDVYLRPVAYKADQIVGVRLHNLTDHFIITSEPVENILLGITRDTVMELARREFGRITRERQIDRTELYVADEILLCGTGAQIAPVIKVDHRPIGDGKVGPISNALQQLYFDVVRGRIPEYRAQWCTPVYTAVPQQAQATGTGS